MTATEVTTNFPLQITFRNTKAPPDAEQWIRLNAAKLNVFYRRIVGCRVTVERPRSHQNGSAYHVRIDLTVSGGELVIKHEPALTGGTRQLNEAEIRKRLEVRDPHKHLRQAINDAFKAAGRRLQDYARCQRGDVKHRETRSEARVTQLFQDKGYGFLATPEGREVYFHPDSVLNRAFGRLKVGTRVTFAEERGDNGPQASSVRIMAKQGTRRVTSSSMTAHGRAREDRLWKGEVSIFRLKVSRYCQRSEWQRCRNRLESAWSSTFSMSWGSRQPLFRSLVWEALKRKAP
jgi:cold shock CspA family protein